VIKLFTSGIAVQVNSLKKAISKGNFKILKHI
jgi:hypothetical protein